MSHCELSHFAWIINTLNHFVLWYLLLRHTSVMLCYRVNSYCLYSWTELVWNVKYKHSSCMYSSVSLHWKASCCFARILHWNSPCCLYGWILHWNNPNCLYRWILHWNNPCCLYRCILHWVFRAVSKHRIYNEKAIVSSLYIWLLTMNHFVLLQRTQPHGSWVLYTEPFCAFKTDIFTLQLDTTPNFSVLTKLKQPNYTACIHTTLS